MTLMGGYRGMSGYWNEYGTYFPDRPTQLSKPYGTGTKQLVLSNLNGSAIPPFHEMSVLLQPQGELYPSQSTFNHHIQDQLLEFHTQVSTRQLAKRSLSKGISSKLNIYESIG